MFCSNISNKINGPEVDHSVTNFNIQVNQSSSLSKCAAKAYSSCLMDRVARVGEEFREAARRRAWMKREEERIQEERKAFWHANVRARGMTRGQFPIT